MTDSFIASVNTQIQNNRQVFQVIFSDMNMNKLNSIRLGKCTDGEDRFYIVHSNDAKHEINLENIGACIAVH